MHHLDIALEILLPADADLSLFHFQIPEFKWQGVKYPQAEPEGHFGPHFKLKFSPLPEYIKRQLPLNYQTNNWLYVSVS